jgi:hypothetical protein
MENKKVNKWDKVALISERHVAAIGIPQSDF